MPVENSPPITRSRGRPPRARSSEDRPTPLTAPVLSSSLPSERPAVRQEAEARPQSPPPSYQEVDQVRIAPILHASQGAIPRQAPLQINARPVEPAQPVIAADPPAMAQAQPNQPAPFDWEAFRVALLGQAPVLPEYRGKDHEDPTRFLTKCEEYFVAARVSDSQKTAVVKKSLLEEAGTWAALYEIADIDWPRFREIFLQKFNSPTVIGTLRAKLYGRKQTEKEEVGPFLQQKYLLYRRVQPDEAEQAKVQNLIGLLRPSIRKSLRTATIHTFDELALTACQLERDEEDERKVSSKSHQQVRKEPDTGANPQPRKERTNELPQCWHCPRGVRHLHKDCPVLRQRGRPQPGPTDPPRPAQISQIQAQRSASQPAPHLGRDQQNSSTNPHIGGIEHEEAAPEITAIVPYQRHPRLPRVRADLEGREIMIAIDTGANTSFVHPSLLTEHGVEYSQTQAAKLAAEGASLTLTGTTTLAIKLAGIPFKVRAHVAPSLRELLVLGWDWVLDNHGIIDAIRQVFYVGTDARVILSLANQRQRINVEIPPGFLDTFPPEYRQAMGNIFEKYSAALTNARAPPPSNVAKHVIKLTTDVPFRIKPYRYAEHKRREIEEQVSEMLEDGVIEPTTSPYNSPVVLVKKKDGSSRFCVDFRRLNAITEEISHALPNMSDTIKDVKQAQIFSVIDLKSGYWQIPLDEDSRNYTAFTSPSGGSYRFRVTPFGLKGAGATFQKAMAEVVLRDYIYRFVLVYLDDIIIFSNSWEEHLRHLEMVMERLALHGLTCALSKCHFGVPEIEYLGTIITVHGNSAKPEYLDSLQQLPIPNNRKELQSFIGTWNWIKEYIPNFASLMAPITDLLKPKEYAWTPQASQALEVLKEYLKTPLTLSRPRDDLPIIVQTDACAIGMGAVLYQEQGPDTRYIISHISAKFNSTELRYHINEKEMLAVIWALRKWKHYLDKHFILRTDSRCVTWLDRFKETKEKLLRWSLSLQDLDFTLEHVPGTLNELPDALSRFPGRGVYDMADSIEHILPPTPPRPVHSEPEIPTLYHIFVADTVFEAQQDDKVATALYERLVALATKIQLTPADQRYLDTHHLDQQGIWVRKDSTKPWQVYVPSKARLQVLLHFHDSMTAGHPGADETERTIRQSYFWPEIRQDVRSHIDLCHLCACVKSTAIANPGLTPRIPTKPWETVALDLMGPYPETQRKKRFILVVTDLFTRWVEAWAISRSEANVIINTLESDVWSRWGYPQTILSDNGPQFTGHEWAQACARWHVTHFSTPVYHPRANPTELRNREIKKGLRLELHNKSHTRWDKYLPSIVYRLRRRRNAATGFTPAQLMLGRDLPEPGQWNFQPPPDKPDWIQARQNQQRYQKKYSKPGRQRQFEVGQQVLIRRPKLSSSEKRVHAGFLPRWEGPFSIIEKLSDNVYRVQLRSTTSTFFVNRLKPWTGDLDSIPEAPTSEPNLEAPLDAMEAGFPVLDETSIPQQAARPRRGERVSYREARPYTKRN